MKPVYGLLLLFCISCNDSPPAPVQNRPKLITRDSNTVRKESVNPYIGVDVSPMDMSYLPVDYPKFLDKVGSPVARVIYSRPHKQGRKIFGSLVKYGHPWRLGANEATEIEFFIPVKVKDRQVARGRYVLYCIPQKDKWTIVFNRDLYSWGLTIDRTKDLFQVDIPFQVKEHSAEYFSMVFEKTPEGGALVIAWDNLEAKLPIQYSSN